MSYWDPNYAAVKDNLMMMMNRFWSISRSKWYDKVAEYLGYRPSKRVPCPASVLGRYHKLFDETCICYGHGRALDHASIWLDADGNTILHSEPYDISGNELRDFLDAMDSNGIDVWVTGLGYWHPRTFRLVMKRRKKRS